jgi:hypothetical protein
VNRFAKHRRAVAWLCIVATLALGLLAQRHALGHALHAMQGSAGQDAWLGHAQACEQCLQFAAVDAAAIATATPMPPARAHALPARLASWTQRSERFSAYVSRAPPHAG